ncbi:MAG: type II secretion system minor pseudopilin GspJ [Parvularculaceae bacterium]|nr:type II secretion system minor pseudopilin GspJ [Parvularculaceae bacterium]
MKHTERGVTLPELLISLLILAMISGVAVYALRLTVEGRDQLSAADAAIRELQVARLLMKEDFLQSVPRVTRDEFGNAQPSAFLGGKGLSFRPPIEGELTMLSFVRDGWTNLEYVAPRPSLQAVEYVLIGDKLVRRTRPYLDDARGQERMDRVLLSNVERASVGFFAGDTSAGLQWTELWPSPQLQAAIPAAVRITVSLKALGEIEQLFYIGKVRR